MSYANLNNECEKASYNINKMFTQSHLHYWQQYVYTENILYRFWAKLTLKIQISPIEYDWKVTLHIQQTIQKTVLKNFWWLKENGWSKKHSDFRVEEN